MSIFRHRSLTRAGLGLAFACTLAGAFAGADESAPRAWLGTFDKPDARQELEPLVVTGRDAVAGRQPAAEQRAPMPGVEGIVMMNGDGGHPVHLAQMQHGHDAAKIAGPEAGKTFRIGDLTIAGPWLRATPTGAKVGGGYMKITNNGKTSDRLVGGSVELAKRFEIHEMAVKDGIMTMRPLDRGLEIKPGETVELKPGGFHVMAMDLADRYVPEVPVKGTLQFEKAGTVAIEYTVLPIGATLR